MAVCQGFGIGALARSTSQPSSKVGPNRGGTLKTNDTLTHLQRHRQGFGGSHLQPRHRLNDIPFHTSDHPIAPTIARSVLLLLHRVIDYNMSVAGRQR